IRTNVKWTLSLRSSPRDAAFLQSALPITGRMRKPPSNPYEPAQFYSPQEERSALLESMASLKDRAAWLWLKSLSPQAIRITTSAMELPTEQKLKEIVGSINSNASIGHRVSREAYLTEMAEREREWVDREPNEKSLDLASAYQKEQELLRCN
ncbi:MAG: hypothetical protein L0312_00920, partial [Acidobacteria bacterium]|nr:hypothetical protein [Acidobacteriota bacterium]